MINYEDVTPSPIPNTSIKKLMVDGVQRTFNICPDEGYVLHDKAEDLTVVDPETNEEKTSLGYVSGMTSCGANYDFTPVVVTDENGVSFTTYGEREFAARLAGDIPKEDVYET